MTELERYKEAVRVAKVGLAMVATVDTDGLCDTGYPPQYVAEDTIESIDAILNPPPVYEDVTVERWECQKCGRVHMGAICTTLPCGYKECNGADYKHLPFTRRVQVARKVERSVSMKARIDETGDAIGLDCIDPFREHPETHRKTGTLTFTWEE